MDINGSEFFVIALLALILVGPERLPEYVRGLRNVILRLRGLLKDGQEALKDELGTDVDWNQLDPRNYDPRRIVREALFDDLDATPTTGKASVFGLATGATGAAASGTHRERRGPQTPGARVAGQAGDGAADVTPFDTEAT